MEQKVILGIVLFLTLVFNYVSPSGALPESDVDKAKANINAERIPQAIELLNKTINEKPDDAEAHFILGTCYLMQGSYRSAQERFDKAISLEPGYQDKIGREYRKTALDAFKNGRIPTAADLFEHGVKFNPSIQEDAYDFFVKLGDDKGDPSASTYYEKALKYTNDKDEEQQIGYRFLKMTTGLSPGSQRKELKNKAIALLGYEKVNEVFPKSFRKTVFEQTYTDADIDPKRGNIIAFTWNDKFKQGDFVEINGHVPEDAAEIAIYLGDNFDPEWKTTEYGNLSYSIEKVPPVGSYYLVRIEKDTEFTLKISRKINPGPNEDLLNRFIK
ncbi:MAG: tetratricopeptide repeat protein [Deltaproteobacteria bacterium]|nr:tetratricopeptide repeat protein [Deltaproteobacteria bacterium]